MIYCVEDDNSIAPLDAITDNLCDEYKLHHIERVQRGDCEYSHGFVFNDILTDLERVGDHCSNLGIEMRIKHGEINDKHGMVSKVELEKMHDFEKYFKGYMEQFGLIK